MRAYGLWVGVLAASLVSVSGQVSVELKLDQQQFLPGESLPVAVRVRNRSGQTLRLGAEPDWLTFAIHSREGLIVSQTAEVPVVGEFELGSSKVATKRVDLAPYFALLQPGHYEITATVRITNWNRAVPPSPPKGLDIIEGSKIWEQEVGVPKAPGAVNTAPEVRRSILHQANYLKGQLRLYVRVVDAYGKSFRVVCIGPMLSFSHPEPQVDRFSNLHLIYQNGPHSFSYTVCNLLGEIIARQTYDYINTRPRLRADEDGNIAVFGGARRVTASDIPPPKDDEEADASSSTSSPASSTEQAQAPQAPPN